MKLSSGKRIGQSGHELYLAAIFSFTLHVIAFSAAILLYTAGPPRISVPAYYNVKLVGLPSEAQQAASSPSPPSSEPAPVLPTPPAQHAPQTKQAPARERRAQAKPNPSAMPELANTKPKPEKAEPERPVEKSVAQSPGPTSAGAAGAAGATGKSGAAGQFAKAEGVAVAAPQGFKPEFQPYVDRVRERISLNWNPPPGSADTAVKVQFTVLRSGRVGDVKLIASSGNFYFDQAAYRAILSSSPFPPLPEGFYKEFELFSVDLMEKE